MASAAIAHLSSPDLHPPEEPSATMAPPVWSPKVDNPPTGPDKKKKKKSRGGKSAAQRGPTALPPSRGSGFEEYYADPPMTPQEAQEEQEEIYADDLSFEERIESCIQRFRGRRRLQGEQTRYFNEYLFLGGIDSNPVPFSGCDPKDLKGLTPAEQRDAKAGTTIGGVDNEEQFYTGDRETWSVDFTGIAAGFFSSMGPITGFEPEPTEMAIGVVENFLRYVLHHDVCPEYDADVKKALNVCEDAREGIPMLLRFQAALPGQFNLAAAKMFGVHGEHDWSFHGFSETGGDPKLNLIASLALMEEPEIFERISQGDHRVVRQFECTVEVSEIQRPDAEIVKRFESFELINADGTPTPALSPIGKAKFKPAVIEDAWEDPVTTTKCRLTLFLDDDILANMKLGMKMSLTVCELDIGLRFVKTVHEVVPTYFTFLPQQLMRYFRSPRDEERPAPSVHDRVGDGEDAG